MQIQKSEVRPVRDADDVVLIRQLVRQWAIELGFSLVDQTKLVTAASEIARNTVIYGGGGDVGFDSLIDSGGRKGLRLTFDDSGPGIADIEQALRDGFTTGQGLGLGLGGTRRLVNDFVITSNAGEGTRVVITKWK